MCLFAAQLLQCRSSMCLHPGNELLLSYFSAHPVAPNICIGRDLQNTMVRLQLQLFAIEADKPTVSYIVHSQPPAGLAWPRVESQLKSFSKSPNSLPIASGDNDIHTPVLFPIWGFYYDIRDCHILCARAWTVLNMCAPALRAELFIA